VLTELKILGANTIVFLDWYGSAKRMTRIEKKKTHFKRKKNELFIMYFFLRRKYDGSWFMCRMIFFDKYGVKMSFKKLRVSTR